MKRKAISVGCIVVSIILMATPYGVAMTFAPGPTERVTKYLSYFSTMPWGYGNWFPLLIALFSIIALLIAIRKKPGNAVQICLIVCIVAAVLSWVMFDSISIVGVIITVLHASAFILRLSYKEHSY